MCGVNSLNEKGYFFYCSYFLQTHAFIFLMVVYVLLINLLIAMMGDTYTRIAEIKNEWMRQVSPLLPPFET